MRGRELLSAYGLSLEQQILGGGSGQACGDPELWRRVEVPLRDGDAQETHCLGLDPLDVMEVALQERGRGGLQGLDGAFEVLEQAALNLYLGPWRDEYKVIKMYSGVFTHRIRPVLSEPQVENLFGLLGYRPGSSQQQQQLRLRVAPPSQDDLLGWACAFFLSRCECRTLRAALGTHAGDAHWELAVVRERRRGNHVQVAVDNARKLLKGEPFGAEVDVDLYTDEHVNGHACSPVVKAHGDAASSREHVCVSTLNCQLTRTSPPETGGVATGAKRPSRRRRQGSRSEPAEVDSPPDVPETPGDVPPCSCLLSPRLYLQYCTECRTVHHLTCGELQRCRTSHHRLETSRSEEAEQQEQEAEPPASPPPQQSEGQTPSNVARASPSLAAMSSLLLDEDPECSGDSPQPIAFHECCDPSRPDPDFLCRSCGLFHASPCRELRQCRAQHAVAPLGVCACGKACSRKPMVLCRYCGSEFCVTCWYRSPVVCGCGQTFDQSSPV